ncbi:hypothetical protein U3516DRAFT_840231 [Neocallimastix sp. 'constans']
MALQYVRYIKRCTIVKCTISTKTQNNYLYSIDESNNVVNVGSDKKIKINKIEKKIKIPYIYIQNNNKYKININKIMMPKPEIALKETINYSNNRVDTKRTIRNYRYKRK